MNARLGDFCRETAINLMHQYQRLAAVTDVRNRCHQPCQESVSMDLGCRQCDELVSAKCVIQAVPGLSGYVISNVRNQCQCHQ